MNAHVNCRTSTKTVAKGHRIIKNWPALIIAIFISIVTIHTLSLPNVYIVNVIISVFLGALDVFAFYKAIINHTFEKTHIQS